MNDPTSSVENALLLRAGVLETCREMDEILIDETSVVSSVGMMIVGLPNGRTENGRSIADESLLR